MIQENSSKYLTEELTHSYSMPIEGILLNPKGQLKPSAYQTLYCDLAQRHLDFYDFGTKATIKHGVVWVLIAFMCRMEKPVTGPTTLTAKTWKSGIKGPYFLRDFAFFHPSGELCFEGNSHSILLDMDTRKICRDKSLPFFDLKEDHYTKFDTSATWKKNYAKDFPQMDASLKFGDIRRVQNSDLDHIGHVNNTRYGDFAYDTLSGDESERMDRLGRLEIYFGSELSPGEHFRVGRYKKEDLEFFRGISEKTGESSFDVVMQFT